MKKTIIITLLLAMVFSLAACTPKEEKPSGNVGVLANMTLDIDGTARDHMVKEHGYELVNPEGKTIKYDNLSTLLMALNSNDISYIGTNSATAAFIMAQNKDLIAIDPTGGTQKTSFSMMTMDNKAEIYELLNNAILALKEDGTLDKLTADYLSADKVTEPKPVEIPTIEGADTIVVAVTGDMPPLDYISSDGKPAGFNVALLSEISKKAGVNIELSNVDSGARMTALSSGRVDAVFWTCATICAECDFVLAKESFEGVLITESYAAINGMVVTKKP